MITKVNKIKDFGIFKNFTWDVSINPFKKQNLIYGWNYSGKTTFSKLFNNLDKKSKIHFPTSEYTFEIELNTETFTQEQLANFPYLIKVFNSFYVKNIFSWDKENSDGFEPILFYLGDEAGNIQPKLAEKSRISDGFLDRFLFCFPESCTAQPDTLEVVNCESWINCITTIYEIPPYTDERTGEVSHIPIRLSAEAQDILAAHNEVLRGLINSTINDLEDPTGGIASKLRIYQYRFALILQVTRYGCGVCHTFREVDAESAKGAVLLAEYFLSTAMKVHSNINDKVRKSYNIRRVHKLLEQGKTIREIADIIGISVGTVSNYSKQLP